VNRFTANVFGGSVSVEPRADTSARIRPYAPFEYELSPIVIKDVDVSRVVAALGDPAAAGKMTGRAFGTVWLAGMGPGGPVPPAQAVRGGGEIDVVDGNFWEAPILKGAMAESGFARDLFTVGEAAAVFRIHDGKVTLTNAAAGSTAVGVHAEGDIGLDGNVDLKLAAVPLTDWRMRASGAGIGKDDPLGKAFHAVVGAAGDAVATVSGAVVAEFHVHGPAANPQIDKVAAPIIGRGLAKLFDGLANKEKDRPMVEQLKDKPGN
jgi:hypothetical protein